MTTSRSALALLESPLALLCFAIWGLNDHVFKTEFPSWLTGKLSDVLCLALIPLLVGATFEFFLTDASTQSGDVRARRLVMVRRLVVVSALLTCGVMVAINTWSLAASAYEWGLGALQWPFHILMSAYQGNGFAPLRPVQLTMDVTDLYTCPASLIPVWLISRGSRGICRPISTLTFS